VFPAATMTDNSTSFSLDRTLTEVWIYFICNMPWFN